MTTQSREPTWIGRAARRAGLRVPLVGLVIAFAVLGGFPPAAAHTFSLLVVAGASGAEADRRDGFTLAVQQSPDVTHAPGTGGDHLGGIDVRVNVVDAGSQDVAARTRTAIADGTRIIVALSPSALDAVQTETARNFGALLVVATGAKGESAAGSALVLSPRSGDGSRLDTFAKDFQEAYGRAPTSTAVAGYDAGLLIDRAVGNLGEALDGRQNLQTIGDGAGSDLVANEVAVARPGVPTGGEGARQDSGVPVRTVILLAVAAAALIAGGLLVVSHRRASPTEGQR